MSSSQIKAIAFDLDDTLLDTSGLLVPQASAEAFKILIEADLKLTLDQCENYRLQWIKEFSHKDVFEKLSREFGTEKTLRAAATATKIFYEPDLPKTLPLLPDARENIDYLKKKYRLYLVTAGLESAQKNKARSLGITNDFLEIFVINSLEKKRKKDAFQQIIAQNNLKPDQLLCIGNSLSSEIYDGLQIGAQTCYFQFGEDRGDLPTDPRHKPDFHIQQHSELIATCRL